MIPERGELVWVNFTPQKGHEQTGRRPALVVSPARYNGVSNCVLVCPITSNTAPWPWKVILPDDGDITGAFLVDQLKSIDAKARKLEASGACIDDAIMTEILARLATLVG